MLEAHPELNRCLLEKQLWQRLSPEVLVSLRIGPEEIRTASVDASRMKTRDVQQWLWKMLKSFKKVENSDYGHLALQLTQQWVAQGPIASFGGALVSPADDDGIAEGFSWFPEGLGVGICVCVNAITDGYVSLGIQVDHRLFDREHSATIHEFLAKEMHVLNQEQEMVA